MIAVTLRLKPNSPPVAAGRNQKTTTIDQPGSLPIA